MKILCLLILSLFIVIMLKEFLTTKNKIPTIIVLLSFILFFIQIYFN